MTLPRLRPLYGLLLLLALLATACTPLRSRNGDGGGRSDDDDAVADDDDGAGDDDDATDIPPDGDLYSGSTSGYLKASGGGGQCSGVAQIYIDESGEVTGGLLSCGPTCEFTFGGVYAFSEEYFTPYVDCVIDGYEPDIFEVEAYIYGYEYEYVSGSLSGYGDSDYFSLSFDAYLGGAN